MQQRGQWKFYIGSYSGEASEASNLPMAVTEIVTGDYGVTDDMYLSLIFAGFEIRGGGDGLSVERFCAAVNAR